MDYRFLKAFILTAKHASFSQAGKDLRIAQSAVSRQIRKLEESLECQLLVRSPHQVKLTQAGRRLFDQALRFHEWATNEFSAAPITIRLGALPGLIDSVVVPRIAKFADQRDMNFSIRADTHSEISAMLLRGDLDACLTHTPLTGDRLTSRKLFTESLVLISQGPVRIDELSEHRWIHMGTSQFLRKLSKVESTSYIAVNSMTALISLVRAGLGVAVVPDHVLVGNDAGIWCKPLELRGQIYLTCQDYDIWPERLHQVWTAFAEGHVSKRGKR